MRPKWVHWTMNKLMRTVYPHESFHQITELTFILLNTEQGLSPWRLKASSRLTWVQCLSFWPQWERTASRCFLPYTSWYLIPWPGVSQCRFSNLCPNYLGFLYKRQIPGPHKEAGSLDWSPDISNKFPIFGQLSSERGPCGGAHPGSRLSSETIPGTPRAGAEATQTKSRATWCLCRDSVSPTKTANAKLGTTPQRAEDQFHIHSISVSWYWPKGKSWDADNGLECRPGTLVAK